MKALLINIESTTKELHPAAKALVYAVLIVIAASALLLAVSILNNPHIKFAY
jgi:hypothetical protein